MKRAISLLISAGIVAVVSSQGFTVENQNTDTESTNYDNNVAVTLTDNEQDSHSKTKEVDTDSNYKETANFENEKDFKKSSKHYNECGSKRGRAFKKGEAKEKAGVNKFRTKEGEFEQALKSGHSDEHKRGNFHQVNFEEAIHVSCENGKGCAGEKVQANRWIKKAHKRRGFNENCGNKRQQNLRRDRNQHLNKRASKKFEEDCKQEGQFGEEGKVVNVHRRAKEVDIDVKGKRTKNVDVETKDKDTYSVNHTDNETDKYGIEKEAGLTKTVTNTKKRQVEVDNDNNQKQGRGQQDEDRDD